MLSVRNLNAYYGSAHILADLSLDVAAGEIVVLLGRNGAGKSTTLKSIMGLVRPRSGEIAFNGERIDGRQPHEIARLGLGYVPEDRRVFTDLSVEQNLDVGRQKPRANAPSWTPEKLFDLFPNLSGMRNRSAAQMSGGEQQMLTIARTLMGNPRLLLLDEPSEGLAPVIVEEMARTIVTLKSQGLTVLLSEQNMHFAALVADRAYVVEKGRIRFGGTMQALASDPKIRQTYLSV